MLKSGNINYIAGQASILAINRAILANMIALLMKFQPDKPTRIASQGTLALDTPHTSLTWRSARG